VILVEMDCGVDVKRSEGVRDEEPIGDEGYLEMMATWR